jgi:hypothetical protein
MWAKVKDLWLQYENKIIFILGLVLVAVLSFEAGVMKGKNMQQNQVVVNQNAARDCKIDSQSAPEGQNLPQKATDISSGTNNQPSNCAFVGSKNSNKYHLPACRWAKQIKPENRVCFSSIDDAVKRGYLPDKNCIK